MYFYSPSTGGFYTAAIHSELPADGVEISQDCHATLLAAQAEGFVIVANPDGYPIAAPHQPTAAELITQMRARRDRLLRESDHTQFPDYPLNSADRAAWAAYRQALRDVPENAIDPTAINWPTAPSGI